MNSENIVQAQVDAYNARDLSKFLDCHATDIERYNFPDNTPYAIGKENLKNIYQDVFNNSPDLNAEITNRMVMGNIVIDHEKVTGRKGIECLEIVAIYEIKDGLITNARFIR